jgi:hypothetical protein
MQFIGQGRVVRSVRHLETERQPLLDAGVTSVESHWHWVVRIAHDQLTSSGFMRYFNDDLTLLSTKSLSYPSNRS